MDNGFINKESDLVNFSKLITIKWVGSSMDATFVYQKNKYLPLGHGKDDIIITSAKTAQTKNTQIFSYGTTKMMYIQYIKFF